MRTSAVALAMTILISGCGDPERATDAGGGGGRGSPSEECASGGGSAEIDWVDFIRLDGVTYDSNYYEQGLRREDIGEPVAEVRCKIADNVTDPEYQIRDGDAAFLEPGTPIYEVRGYPSWFRLAAEQDGEWVLYEPDTVPDAETGADLLALEGRIDYIGINSSYNGTRELARIEDPQEVERLVGLVLAAPVDQDRQYSDADLEDQVFIEFGFDDGTRTIRAFGPHSGQLSRGILTPEAFGEAVEEALQERS